MADFRKDAQLRRRFIAISLSLLIGATIMGVKFYVYWLTRSSAILSDALESIINVVASAFALWSIILSAKPPDPTHPYGHGKIEYFSAGFEGALIILAAIGILWKAAPQILHPHELPNLQSGLWVLLGANMVNLLLGLGLVRVGKQTRSLVLIADGKHILSDVYTTAGVLVGLILVHMTGWLWLDGAIACLVALNILVVGTRLVRESFAGLMNASEPKLLEEITEIFERYRRSSWINLHRLRAWRSGTATYIDFHLILPRDLTLEEAHQEVSFLEEVLKKHLEGTADPLIHAEPCIDPNCSVCQLNPCELHPESALDQTNCHSELPASRLSEHVAPSAVGKKRREET